MSRRKWGSGRRLRPRDVLALVVGGVFAVVLLTAGIDRIRDHAILMERGVVVDAAIVEVGSRRTVTVQFSTDRAEQVQAVVMNAPSGVALVNGGTLPVRYDPADPAGRIEPVDQDQAVITRWFLVVSGALLLGLVIYGSAWWALRLGRSRTQAR